MMDSVMDKLINDYGRLNTSTSSPSSEQSPSSNDEPGVKQRETVVQWLNGFLSDLNLPINASDEEVRAVLVDGSVLCELLKKLKPEAGDSTNSLDSCSENNVTRFLSAVEKLGLSSFQPSDLENGSMRIVFDCLLAIRNHFRPHVKTHASGNMIMTRWKSLVEHGEAEREEAARFRSFKSFGEERRKSQRASSRSPVMAESSAALIHHVGHKFHEVFQLKQGSYADLPAAKISEMIKSNSLDNAPTQSLLTLVNGIIDESIERKNGEIPHRVACLLRKVVQEIERRISTQAEHLRMQNNLFKAREEKYQSRIRVLEALATGTTEETQIVMNQLQQIKSEKTKMEVKKKTEEHDVARLMKEKDETDQEITALREEVETARKTYEEHCSQVEQEARRCQQEIAALKQQLEASQTAYEQCSSQVETKAGGSQQEIEALKRELETARKTYEEHCSQVVKDGKGSQQEIAVLKQELEKARKTYEEHCSKAEKDGKEIAALKQELETARKTYEEHCSQAEKDGKEIAILKQELETARKTYEEYCSQAEKDGKEIAILKQELETSRKTYEEHCSLAEKDGKVIAILKQELETSRKTYEQHCSQAEKDGKEIAILKQELETARKTYEEYCLKAEKDGKEIAVLRQELEAARKTYEEHCSQVEQEARRSQQEIADLKKEHEEARETYEQYCTQAETKARGSQQQIEALKQELETAQKNYEQQCSQMEKEARGSQQELEKKLKEVTSLLTKSRNRVKELEMLSETKALQWNKTRHIYEIFTEFQLGALRELKFSSQSIKQEVVKTQKIYIDEFNCLGVKTRILEDAAANYHVVVAENRKLHNEVQELKGNIRVYCRVRPFLPAQKDKQTIVEHVGDNGELIVMNPSKQGKEGWRSFRFNKVYDPAATQAQVFSDIQPLIRSVLDGYSVCIFAYGQTGSGKTYTMTGPDGATEEEWGVNYRALNDLFQISQKRQHATKYEIAVQMVEIYNEQIRDLLSSDASQKNLAVLPTTQPNGLAVPDASMYPVKAASDVMDLMNIGLKNRAKSSTALNERSSRSHSVVTIHVCGTEVRSGSSTRSSLHLVDLAGSERVDRSEVKGDRLKEAQHINKSLAALGDVISALAQKSPHIPYRNSKLTQVLQTSLGGQAKTLMFVQLNPDHSSYSESVSTLKFAERVSGVELGAAKSSKEGKDVRELMEQLASLKDSLTKRDEEIERLRHGKTPGVNGEKRAGKK